MPEVMSISTVWLNRAREAENAARELERLVSSAGTVLSQNRFGVDCVEGRALFVNLNHAVELWRSSISAIAEDLATTALHCRTAAAHYELVDSLSASEIGD
ncbi:hypothetical protein GOHSU_35_00310 [Gordonia hirsuta DSM 44140 = NBRC 16056]|uniref:Uncharacterized protein n=1 Tax=Gordonia hirsuta DSM 44140 = NBRC 16056 TaxID=1121927 RepID=L7LBW0_9ACTN|nr:hypothetical protein GOHSU_35_00310 [Gordonia hirsuta DSM 44140 = NBRC 16056]